MLHCGGGPGPGTVDWLATLDGWVGEKVAPAELTAPRRGRRRVAAALPLSGRGPVGRQGRLELQGRQGQMTAAAASRAETGVLRKVAWRLIPFMGLLYFTPISTG